MSTQTDEASQNKEAVKVVYLSYIKWFIGASLLALFASVLAYWANLHPFLTALQIRIIQIMSLVPEATALGQCGYNIQTWGGESPAEKLNGRLFTTLSAVGFFLIVFTFQLEA
jgi:hypothetical protein